MNRTELVYAVKQYCKENKVEFIDDVKVGSSILVLVSSVGAVEKLEDCLTKLGVKHTTPMITADAIGSYVSLY